MDRITYQEMVERYGKRMAQALLTEVETNAGITREVRLQRALDVINKTDPVPA